MRATRVSALCGAIMIVLIQLPAQAGPPLSIDDPGILDPGSFEIIVASTFESRDSGEQWLLPILDVSYGLGPDLQLGMVATRAVADPDEGRRKSDFGPASVGIKWRFLDAGDLQMSVAPFFETLLRDGAADRGIVEDADAWVLPVQWQYQLSQWRLNAELRYSAVSGEDNEWGYGVAAAHPLNDHVELMAELYGGTDSSLHDHGALYRLGADVRLSERWHLLVSLGSAFDEPGDDDTDLQGYFGLQWFP
jgi:outer membrane receptor protein involved in Fe transport